MLKLSDFQRVYVVDDIDQEEKTVEGGIKLLYTGKKQEFKFKSGYTPKEGDKIHFLPDCTVPRFKIKDYCEKYKVSVVRDPDKANAIFGIDKYLEGFIQNSYEYQVPVDIYNQFISKFFGEGTINHMKHRGVIKQLDSSFILTGSTDSCIIDETLSIEMEQTYDLYEFFKQEKGTLEKFLEYLDPEGRYFHQNDILKSINTNVMTREMYDEIKTMLSSDDKDNHVIALEIMTNSDYEKSCIWLLLLFKEYGNPIYDCNTRHHVNFKALIEFLDIKGEIHRINSDRIISILRKKKLLTKEVLRTVMGIVAEEIQNDIRENSFRVKSVVPTSEVLSDVVDREDEELEHILEERIPEPEEEEHDE